MPDSRKWLNAACKFLGQTLGSVLLLASAPVAADWVNLTGAEIAPNIAEIYIHDTHVEVRLEVYVGDIAEFEELIPDEWLTNLNVDRPPLEQREAQFAARGLRVLDANGEALPAEFRLVEPRSRVERRSPFAGKINPYNLRKLPEAPEDKRVLYAEIVYPLKGRPDRLTFVPPLNADGVGRVTMGFIAYHNEVPLTDFRYLGRPEAIDLDWDDPWFSRFENKNLVRHHKYPIMLFLYAEPRRIRFEAIMRMNDLEQMLEFTRDAAQGGEATRDLLQAKMEALLRTDQPMTVDGQKRSPDMVRIEYLRAGLLGIQRVEADADVNDPSLLIGIVAEYYVETLPDRTEFEWLYFNPQFDQIPVAVSDPVGPLFSLIDRDTGVMTWQNFLKEYREPEVTPVEVPTGWVIDLPFLGSTQLWRQLPEAPQAQAIVEGVLLNLRAAFIEIEGSARDARLAEVIESTEIDRPGARVVETVYPAGAR